MNRGGLHHVVVVILIILLTSPTCLISEGYSDSEVGQSADTIIYNGDILTMEQSPDQVEAVAIQGEAIHAIGDESDILAMAGPHTRIIDLDGRTLLPGFIDSHSHWIISRLWTGWDDTREPTTMEEQVEKALRGGWTSITEISLEQEHLNELISFDQENPLPLRVSAYLKLNENDELLGDWYQAYQPEHEFSSKLRIGGVKIFMDRWFTQWHHHFNQTKLDTLVHQAHEAGYQIAIHCVTDNGTDIVLNSLESALGGESNHLYRHRIEHLFLLGDDQIQRMADLGIIASIQLAAWNSDDIVFGTNPWYVEYSHLIARYRDIVQAGIPTIGNSDYPFISGFSGPAMQAVSIAVTKVGEQGSTPPEWILNQSLTVEQTLRSLTIDGAYGMAQEDVIGSIKAGKLADLVVLSDNPLTVPEDSLIDIEVLMTMIGGEIEYMKEGVDLSGQDSTALFWFLLLPTLCIVSFIALVVFIVVRKNHS